MKETEIEVPLCKTVKKNLKQMIMGQLKLKT